MDAFFFIVLVVMITPPPDQLTIHAISQPHRLAINHRKPIRRLPKKKTRKINDDALSFTINIIDSIAN